MRTFTYPILWLALAITGLSACQSARQDNVHVSLDTTEGEILLLLYNETPLHRNHFVDQVRQGTYDGLSFNRVIEGFMIQCGEEEAEDVIQAEIDYPRHYHKRGALAMGRCTDDPDLKSASRQFYIVWGKANDEACLQRDDSLMQAWSHGRHSMVPDVRQYYLSHPGVPWLDGNYTVFGEVVRGLDVVERIQQSATDATDRPLQEVVIRKASIVAPPATGEEGKQTATTAHWKQKASHVDAYRLEHGAEISISCQDDTLYTLHNWYGVEGYDVQFTTERVGDSTLIRVTNADDYRSGYYYVKTGLKELPVATIYPGLFAETNTLCSGFRGNRQRGKVWAYTYLYSPKQEWKGGHLYTLMWGEEPEKPLWSVRGTCHLVGNVPSIESTLEAYEGGRYILRDWYGVEKYDLEFRLRKDGGIEVLDYYWTENGCRYVQCRREDISCGVIPQTEKSPNGSLRGDARSGSLRFRMTVHDNDDRPIADALHPEFVFEW